MSKKPVLVVMAAGMGSRYGGLKQIDPVDEYGNIIMDFSMMQLRLDLRRLFLSSRKPLRRSSWSISENAWRSMSR